MGKITNLKQWLTISEAIDYISEATGESVKEVDLYHLALDGKLTLSVKFTEPQKAQEVTKLVDFFQDTTDLSDVDNLLTCHINHPDGYDFVIIKDVPFTKTLVDIYDLPLYGNEKAKIEYMQDKLLFDGDLPFFAANSYLGTFVKSLDGTLFCLVEETEFEIVEGKCVPLNPYGTENPTVTKYTPINYFPCGSLFVIRLKEVERFVNSILDTGRKEKSIGSKERKSLHLIVAALVELAELDIEKPYQAATDILCKIKESNYMSENTIVSHLKAAKETVK